jgi:hypothetical protein
VSSVSASGVAKKTSKKDESMSNIVSECFSVDLTDGSRHSKKAAKKSAASPKQMTSPMSSPNIVQKTSVVVVGKEEGKDEVDFMKGVQSETKIGLSFIRFGHRNTKFLTSFQLLFPVSLKTP